MYVILKFPDFVVQYLKQKDVLADVVSSQQFEQRQQSNLKMTTGVESSIVDVLS